MSKHSTLLSESIAAFVPLIFMVGAYVTVNGHLSPGGGFQGGAVIFSIFICKYFILPIHDTRLDVIERTEKLTLLFIWLIPLFFLFAGLSARYPGANTTYLIAMNVLIALKVACGFTILFQRFVYFEVR